MNSSKPTRRNPDKILLAIVIMSSALGLVCLAVSLQAYLQGVIQAQRNHPTVTPLLYGDLVELAYAFNFYVMPAIGLFLLIIGVSILKYRHDRRIFDKHTKDAV